MSKLNLDGLKLVYDDSYYADRHEVEAMVEVLIQQASQGWGLTRRDQVLLSVLRLLRDAQQEAELSDERGRMLKGAQLENGRLKKQLAAVKEKYDAERDRNLSDNLKSNVNGVSETDISGIDGTKQAD